MFLLFLALFLMMFGIGLILALRFYQYRSIIDSMPVGIIAFDAAGYIVGSNKLAKHYFSVCNDNPLLPMSETVLGSMISDTIAQNENEFELDLAGRKTRLRILNHDTNLSQKKRRIQTVLFIDLNMTTWTEQEERRRERYDATSSLAAGIAHEVRNPLSALAVNMQLMEEQLNPSQVNEKAFRYMNIIKSEVKRLNNIVDDFIRFAKPEVIEMTPESPMRILGEIIDLVEPECEKKNINIIQEQVIGEACEVPMDDVQIKQALLNVVINGIQSMPKGGSLSTGIEFNEEYIIFRISDTGGGIPEESLSKVFDLFYTKRKGGSGLGLSLSQKSIDAHNGYIYIRNHETGAICTIGLPVSRKDRKTWKVTNAIS